jgi:hypothetical protein
MATNCHDMKLGEVYVCKDCGLELKVVAECHDAGKSANDCDCPPCTFVCCGKTLELKAD